MESSFGSGTVSEYLDGTQTTTQMPQIQLTSEETQYALMVLDETGMEVPYGNFRMQITRDDNIYGCMSVRMVESFLEIMDKYKADRHEARESVPAGFQQLRRKFARLIVPR